MAPIEQLRDEARRQRDARIQEARDDYHKTMRELRAVARRLKKPQPRKPRLEIVGDDFSSMTVRQAAETVLAESGALRLTEITVAIMSRGCRSADNPRAVAHAVHSALRYHKGRFSRDGEGRWVVLT